jgi:alkylated DNA repair dioxygenase AlkB
VSDFTSELHDLGDGYLFKEGRLPADLNWDKSTFEQAWSLHPEGKHQILMHGRLVQTPRWQQAYGADYHYTGRVNEALPVPALFQPLLDWAQREIDAALNGILLNWYEGPGHYIGPHNDSTVNMIKATPIVTISFGETRVFRLSKGVRDARKVSDFPAPDGTVFVMPYDTNLAWKHSVPKSTKYVGRRISVTFRAFERDSVR